MEQFARDARITTLYEGTTQIQALDLLGRKVLQLQGAGLRHFLLDISAFCEAQAAVAEMSEFIGPLAGATKALSDLTMEIAKRAVANPEEMGAAAYDYLFFSGYVALAYFWAKSVVAAASRRRRFANRSCRRRGSISRAYCRGSARTRRRFVRVLRRCSISPTRTSANPLTT